MIAGACDGVCVCVCTIVVVLREDHADECPAVVAGGSGRSGSVSSHVAELLSQSQELLAENRTLQPIVTAYERLGVRARLTGRAGENGCV